MDSPFCLRFLYRRRCRLSLTLVIFPDLTRQSRKRETDIHYAPTTVDIGREHARYAGGTRAKSITLKFSTSRHEMIARQIVQHRSSDPRPSSYKPVFHHTVLVYLVIGLLGLLLGDGHEAPKRRFRSVLIVLLPGELCRKSEFCSGTQDSKT